jgi:catalase
MTQPPSPEPQSKFGALISIAVVAAVVAGLFAYTAGWFSPQRLTPTKLVDSLAPPTGPALGYRRNHAKGVCFRGVFESNGNGTELSRARVFSAGQYPALGRFNLGTPDPNAADAKVRVRGLGLQISTPDGEVWRSAMIDLPFFPVATPQAFYELQVASQSKDPDAMKTFSSAHPEISAFGAWAKSAPWTGSYAEEPYNGLNAFTFVDNSGADHAVRWSLRPQAQVTPITADELGKLGPDHLEQELKDRVTKEPARWTMVVTAANPEDPTSDPSKAWPEGRRTVDVGTLVVQEIVAERDGPCRDINFDPTILPKGIKVSDDPFPAARSAAYAKSYDLRTSETKYYPYHQNSTAGGSP